MLFTIMIKKPVMLFESDDNFYQFLNGLFERQYQYQPTSQNPYIP